MGNATIQGWFPRICHGSVPTDHDDDVDDMMKRLCFSAEGNSLLPREARAKLEKNNQAAGSGMKLPGCGEDDS
jgi:hypothetical protein